jgi:putative redox protein
MRDVVVRVRLRLMPETSSRAVELTRLAKGRYRATNQYGDSLVFGEGGGDGTLSPVELLLAAMAGCTAIDVDYIVGKRAEPVACTIRSEGVKVRDEGGNHLTDLVITFDMRFDPGQAGAAAREVLPRALEQSNNRLCTVSRTIRLGADVRAVLGRVEADQAARVDE